MGDDDGAPAAVAGEAVDFAAVARLLPRRYPHRLIDRVLASQSELNELWEENDEEYPEWKAGVLELRKRLGG